MTAHAQGSLWYYAPNKGAPIAFAILFAATLVLHVFNTYRTGMWKLGASLIFGTAMLAAGYAMRSVGAFGNYDSLGIFVPSQVLIVVGPPVYAAHVYVALGRAMYYVPWLAPMHPGRVITTYLALDTLCEALLGTGISYTVNPNLSESEHQAGTNLARAGLILLVVMFVLFLIQIVHFHLRCAKNGVASKLRGVFVVLYITSLLILERSIYRAIEYFEGVHGSIYRNETLFWILEGSAMLLVSGILAIWPLMRMLPRTVNTYLSTDGVTERQGPGWIDIRPMVATIFDPFGLCTGEKSTKKFWEDESDLPVAGKTDVPKDIEASPLR